MSTTDILQVQKLVLKSQEEIITAIHQTVIALKNIEERIEKIEAYVDDKIALKNIEERIEKIEAYVDDKVASERRTPFTLSKSHY